MQLLQIDFLDSSCDPLIWRNLMILDGKSVEDLDDVDNLLMLISSGSAEAI
jgi:hypothetical protein